MTTYLSRSAWTSTSAGGATLTGSELVGVAVHWPGTTQSVIGVQSQAATAERIRAYRNFHVNVRGWSDLGYNMVIDQAGRVWQGRTTQWRGNRVGAHAASSGNPRANHKYVGVLLILGANETPSAAMIRAFQDWYHDRFLPGWPGRTDVRGHGQVPGASTSCPGSHARAAIGWMIRKPTTPPPPPPPKDDDMPYRDWPKADKDALLDDVARAVHRRVNPQTGIEYGVMDSRMYRRYYEAQPRLGDPDTQWHGIRYLRGLDRDMRTALAGQAGLLEAVGQLLEHDSSNPLTKADLEEAVERGMRRVQIQVQVLDEIDPDGPDDPDEES